MQRSHYPLWYRLDNKDRYLIWYSVEGADEDLDGVFLDSSGKTPVFISLDALFAYAHVENITPEQGELNIHNLDAVVAWLKRKRPKPEGPTSINCAEFTAAWNLFTEVSRSIGADFDRDKDTTKKIHCKLFWGSNLPSVTPAGKSYIPLWSRTKKQMIRELMLQGLQMFRNSIKCE